MTTPPTPAEVAEARTFLTGVETGSVESFLLDLKHSEVYRRHAAVLVRYALACGERAALAAPAETKALSRPSVADRGSSPSSDDARADEVGAALDQLIDTARRDDWDGHWSAGAWGQTVSTEIQRLRARVAELETAGDAMEGELRGIACEFTGAARTSATELLDRWRAVRGER